MTDGVSIVPDDGGVVMGVLQRPTHAHARREGVELVERDSGADVSRRRRQTRVLERSKGALRRR